MKRILLLLFPMLLTAVPAQVIIIRHGEKDKVYKSDHLNLQGRERAAALVPFVQNDPRMLQRIFRDFDL